MTDSLHTVAEKLYNIKVKASKIDAYYVVIFFKSRITKTIEERHAFFEDHMEALEFSSNLGLCYKDYKYHIFTNTFAGEENGGLL